MTPETLFTLASAFAALGWIAIIVLSPFWKNYDKFVLGIIVVILALVYCWLNFSDFHISILKSFSSLDGVAALFQNKDMLNGCWLHILAFDLTAAVWMKKNSVMHGIKHWVMVPVFIVTIMFAPFGYFIYMIVRWVKTKNYFAHNFNMAHASGTAASGTS